MKTINLDFLGADDTIFHLLLAYIYDEVKDLRDSPKRQIMIPKIVELDQMDVTLRHIRFGGYDYRDGLENLVGLTQTIHIYEAFINFIKEFFPDYKNLLIIGKTKNTDWEEDLNKISIKYQQVYD